AKNPPKARAFSTPNGRKDVTPEQPTAITSKKKHKNRNAGKQRSR
ncbi:membrane protein insertase YidC, partial [Streptococcus mitis]|nr:membrane protein insertase YidC [Streptococcus mitis]